MNSVAYIESLAAFLSNFFGIGSINQDHLSAIKDGRIQLPERGRDWFVVPNWRKFPNIIGSRFTDYRDIIRKLRSLPQGRLFIEQLCEGVEEKYQEPYIFQQNRAESSFWGLLDGANKPDIVIVPLYWLQWLWDGYLPVAPFMFELDRNGNCIWSPF